jgi:hypothetical protein
VDQVDVTKWTCEAAISNTNDKKMKSTFGILEVLYVTAVMLLIYC